MDKNMKNVLILLIGLLTFSSCEKTEIQPNNQTIVVPPYTGPTVTPQSMVGTKWVITGYRVGQLGTPITISDTLKFETTTNYKYNNTPYTYSFYVTGSVYNLTMNYTPWGNLTGSVNDNNMTSGLIQGTKFIDISLGTSNNTEYYLWIKKI